MFHIYDENSTSGTWVNDQQVIDYGLQLLDGDELYLGKVTLRFHMPG
jgi:pSer/pThr/pTyr-binding forkhead associated (FHA) protein